MGLLMQINSMALAQKLQAIDPSTLQLDDSPSSGSAPSGGFNNTPIQGRPLGSTFQPINQPAQSGGRQPDRGAGFGTTMSPPSDDPVVSAQDEERVNSLEQKAFGCNYHEHEVPDRLDHLEKEVLGSPRDGPIPDRITKLEMKLFGGTGFGAQTGSTSRPPQAPPSAGGTSGGNAWLTQPAGTPAQRPAPVQQQPTQSAWQTPTQVQPPGQSDWQTPTQMQQPPMQSDWQTPGQMQQPPMQSDWQTPTQTQNQQQPAQSAWQTPSQMPSQGQFPPMRQSSQQPGQQMPPQQQQPRQQMPAQQQQPRQQPPRQQMPAQQQPSQLPQQAMPGQQQQYSNPQNFGRPPIRQATQPVGLTADASLVANSLFYDVKSGDYLSAIRRFPAANGQPGQTYAHWRSFPVRVRLPKDSPESWQRALEAVVARWDQYVPVKLALPLEAAPLEVTWVNTLPPKVLAVTRLNIAHGEMRVTIYLLRPSYYPPEIPERTLAGIFMHEVGHGLGLFGHSDKPSDLMFPAEIQPAAKGRPAQIHFAPVSTRDINTLKKIYESPAVPPGISLEQPLEWSVLTDHSATSIN
jgi:predicted Zn-dependent protease